MSGYFILYKCCILTKGKKRTLIVDTQRQKTYYVSNEVYSIILDLNTKELDIVKKKYDEKVVKELIAFLISNELGFYTDEIERFKELDTSFYVPNLITNAIVVCGKKSNHDFNRIINELDSVACQAIELRFLYNITEESFHKIIEDIKSTNAAILSISIIIPFIDLILEHCRNLLCSNPQISYVYLYSAPYNAKEIIENTTIILSTHNNLECGKISTSVFSPNLQMIIESMNRNNCLNGKVCIDADGSIKNCPSMNLIYGNIKKDRLVDIVNQKDFQKLWFITKDQIKTCMDCEYRYICPDCRKYIENPNDSYSHPCKCNYNPYMGAWIDIETTTKK